MAQLRVAIAGIRGKMGQETARAVLAAPDMTLVAGIDRTRESAPDATPWSASSEIPVYTDCGDGLASANPDVLVDFTHGAAALAHAAIAVLHGVRPVIGTTGLTRSDLEDLNRALREAGLGGLYAPNFAIGAILMMRAAAMAAPYLWDVEIVEYHHAQKRDAPSGTSIRTAEEIARARGTPPNPETGLRAAQGQTKAERVAGIPIHSVRMSGFVAHQEVIFGGDGERLTIRHDSLSRASFMPGVLLGIRKVRAASGLVEGLEHFLF